MKVWGLEEQLGVSVMGRKEVRCLIGRHRANDSLDTEPVGVRV